MSVTFNVTTSRFRSVLVMVASIDLLSAPASRLTARLAPVGSLARDLDADRRAVLRHARPDPQRDPALLAGVFAVTVGMHSIRLWVVYLLALALGFVNVFDNPARQSFISEMVSTRDLPNAVTLNSVAANMARVFGAALGGVIRSEERRVGKECRS